MSLEAILFTLLLNQFLIIIGAIATGLFLFISMWVYCNTQSFSSPFSKIRLIKKKSLLLLHVLVIFDFLTYVLGWFMSLSSRIVSGLPYTIYLLSGWNNVQLNYDPVLVFATDFAGMVHIKGSILILLGIAVDRFIVINPPIVTDGNNF